MNSDPHESAAWRTFGMIDSEEASAFDETMRHDPELRNAYAELDRLAAAVAVTATVPIAPRAVQLERLHLRLGLSPQKRPNWLGISGWAVAASLALLLVIDRSFPSSVRPTDLSVKSTEVSVQEKIAAEPVEPVISEEEQQANAAPVSDEPPTPPVPEQAKEQEVVVKVETKRLIQEIEVLREKLETVEQRDRQRFEPRVGMAWPIVMRMLPPATSGEIVAENEEEPNLTDEIVEALASSSMASTGTDQRSRVNDESASGTPIYDPTRGQGTLMVKNLPDKKSDEDYILWVKTDQDEKPLRVGRLPEYEKNIAGSSFDFSLGTRGVVPTEFILTKGKGNNPDAPSVSNTVLKGPK